MVRVLLVAILMLGCVSQSELIRRSAADWTRTDAQEVDLDDFERAYLYCRLSPCYYEWHERPEALPRCRDDTGTFDECMERRGYRRA